MNCPKCNQFVPDGSRFCQSCGANLMEEQPEEAVKQEPDMAQAEAAAEMAMGGATTQTMEPPVMEQQVGMGMAPNYGQPGAYMPEGQQMAAAGATVVKKGVSKPVLFGLIGGGVFLVAAAITLVIVFAVVGGKTTYNLQDYTEVTFEGVDGSGTAEANLSKDLMMRMAEDIGIDLGSLKNDDGVDWSEAFTMASSHMGDIMKLYGALSSVELKLDKTDQLKNGDTVTITYTFDAEKAKEAGAEFIGEPMTKTVSGLEEVKEVDPFEGLEVSFEGTSPNAYVTYENNATEEPLNYVWFDTDTRDGLKAGDTVTIKVGGYDEESFEKNYGVRFSQTEKTYTVENVDAFITENQALDPAALDVMKTATEGYIEEYFGEASRKENVKAEDVTYEGYYLLTNKESEGIWNEFNKVYVVYSATVSGKGKGKKFKPTKVFFPVEYDDIKQLADGSYEIETAYKRILGSTDLQFGFWEVVSGYEDVALMYDELVTAEEAKFDGVAYDNLG